MNQAGRVAEQCWLDIPSHFPHLALDAFVIMPNHIHGILWIVETPPVAMVVGAKNFPPLQPPSDDAEAQYVSAPRPHGTSRTIGSVVRGFKIGVTQWFRQNTTIHAVWQRNYYEHIIRDGTSLQRIRDYITANPQQWVLDRENPASSAMDDAIQS